MDTNPRFVFFITIRWSRTNSSGVEAQGGSWTSPTTVPSSCFPKWNRLLLTKHLGKVEKLGYQFLDVRRVALAVFPGLRHRSEGPVGVVEFPSLEVEEEGGKGLLAHQPGEDERRCGVVCSVMEGRDLVMLPGRITLFEEFLPVGIQGTDRLQKN